MTADPATRPAGIVHIVDDDDSMRKSLARLLGAAGFEARVYASGAEYMMAPDTDGMREECLLLDVRMPGPDGLELHEALARRANALPVVFLTGHGDIPMSVRAMKAGAVDFLTKPVRREALLAAVRAALARHLQRRSTDSDLEALRSRHASLTPREHDVFVAAASGRLNKQIAFDLGVAERTVKAYRAGAMEKLKADTFADLVRIAEKLREAGILAPAPPPRR